MLPTYQLRDGWIVLIKARWLTRTASPLGSISADNGAILRICRFSNHASFQEILNELNDYAGQRELVAENMITGICVELTKYLQDLKQERKGVREGEGGGRGREGRLWRRDSSPSSSLFSTFLTSRRPSRTWRAASSI